MVLLRFWVASQVDIWWIRTSLLPHSVLDNKTPNIWRGRLLQITHHKLKQYGCNCEAHLSHDTDPYAELCLSTSRATVFTIDASSRAAWRIPIMSYSGPYGFPLTTTPCQRLLHSPITSCQAVVFTFFNRREEKLHCTPPCHVRTINHF